LARDKFQCIDRNSYLESLAPCALRQDRRLQKIGNGFDQLDWIWAILHDLCSRSDNAEQIDFRLRSAARNHGALNRTIFAAFVPRKHAEAYNSPAQCA